MHKGTEIIGYHKVMDECSVTGSRDFQVAFIYILIFAIWKSRDPMLADFKKLGEVIM